MPLKYPLITLNNFIHDSFMNVFQKVMHALYIAFFVVLLKIEPRALGMLSCTLVPK